MSEFERIRKRVSDEAYAHVRSAGLLEACVVIGAIAKDSIDRELDSLKIAAEVERSVVLLVSRLLKEPKTCPRAR